MGTLKKIVDDLPIREDDLKALKVRLVNKINFKRKSINLGITGETAGRFY